MVPVETGLEIFEEARRRLAGLAKNARLCMSHARAKSRWSEKWTARSSFVITARPNPHDCGRVMVFDSDPSAGWLDDYYDSIGAKPMRPVTNVKTRGVKAVSEEDLRHTYGYQSRHVQLDGR